MPAKKKPAKSKKIRLSLILKKYRAFFIPLALFAFTPIIVLAFTNKQYSTKGNAAMTGISGKSYNTCTDENFRNLPGKHTGCSGKYPCSPNKGYYVINDTCFRDYSVVSESNSCTLRNEGTCCNFNMWDCSKTGIPPECKVACTTKKFTPFYSK